MLIEGNQIDVIGLDRIEITRFTDTIIMVAHKVTADHNW